MYDLYVIFNYDLPLAFLFYDSVVARLLIDEQCTLFPETSQEGTIFKMSFEGL